jgi:hypothetical protein
MPLKESTTIDPPVVQPGGIEEGAQLMCGHEGKLDRLAKQQKTMQGKIDNLLQSSRKSSF